jgi:hypothetical protein
MKSLADLNNYSAQSIEVQDDRPAGVRFDRPEAQEQRITFSSLSFNSIPNGIEITEIINYVISEPKIIFNIISPLSNPLTGSTLSWNALPDGVTLTTVGQIYTLSGINSVDIWNIVKNPNWTIPADFASKTPWYLEVTISYFDQELFNIQSRSYEVFDPRYTYDSLMKAISSLSFNISRIRNFQSNLSSNSSLIANSFDVKMDAFTSLSAIAADVIVAQANIQASAALSVETTVTPAISTNINLTRTYIANKENQIFSANTPQITDLRSGTYSVTLTSPNGEFGTTLNSSTTSLTLTGTKETINAAIAGIYFYPNAGYLGNTTVVWQQSRNGISYITKTLNVNYAGNNLQVKQYTYLTPGSFTFTPTFVEKKYLQVQWLVVGGGGPASSLIGGNAGKYTNGINLTPLNSYSVTVGNPASSSSIISGGSSLGTGGAGTSNPLSQQITVTAGQLVGGAFWVPSSAANTVVFSKGNGGANANNGWGTADQDGRVSTGLSQNRVGNEINVFRTEYAGEGGVSVFWNNYSFGRGGNGRVDIPSFPVIAQYTQEAGPTLVTWKFFTTDGNIKTSNGNITAGNGGDAPSGSGRPGAVIFVLKVRQQ